MGQLKAILNGKCPKCEEGDIFKYSTLKLSSFHKMHEHCPVCGLKYEREPGFFIGAMYVNYAFTVAIVIAVGIALNVLGFYSLYAFVGSIVSLVFLFMPVLFRFSRILFLHFFGGVKYDPSFKKQS